MISKSTCARTAQETPLVQQSTDHKVISTSGGKGAKIRPRPSVNSSGRYKKMSNRAREPRFFAMLSDEQVRIAERISRGFHLRTAGLGMRTQSYSRLPPTTGGSEDWQVGLMRRFMLWAVRTQEAGISLAAVLDVIVFGKSCRAVDRARRKRNGFARAQLLEALELYKNL